MQTNGYDLSDEMIAFFAKEHFLVGVSLDGTAQTHDLMRPDAAGRPTASVVRKTIERLREAGVASTCCASSTAKWPGVRPRSLMRSLRMNISNSPPASDGLDGQTRDYSLSGEAYLAFLKETFDRYHLAYTEGRPVSIRNFDNWIAMLMGAAGKLRDGRALRSSLVIEKRRKRLSCDFHALDAWKLGSISDDSLRRMLTGEREQAFLAESLPSPPPAAHASGISCAATAASAGNCSRNRG